MSKAQATFAFAFVEVSPEYMRMSCALGSVRAEVSSYEWSPKNQFVAE